MDSHHPVRVGVAEFKARLSAFLRGVRRGHAVTLYDRDTPIARVVPYAEPNVRLVIRPARGALHDVPLPPPLRRPVNVLAALAEERAERR